ncbi:hypothetical protein QL285_071389 [Trifolium repens]|nr:hypothetical protein QL285_071389 [Trifolium repens]
MESIILNVPSGKNHNTWMGIIYKTRFSSKVESTSGEAIQMIRELQWFKEIDNLDHPLHKEVKIKDSKTASQVFMEEHRQLVKEAKNWIKDRSDSCILVATLIATINFAAAIYVPGGSRDASGP